MGVCITKKNDKKRNNKGNKDKLDKEIKENITNDNKKSECKITEKIDASRTDIQRKKYSENTISPDQKVLQDSQEKKEEQESVKEKEKENEKTNIIMTFSAEDPANNQGVDPKKKNEMHMNSKDMSTSNRNQMNLSSNQFQTFENVNDFPTVPNENSIDDLDFLFSKSQPAGIYSLSEFYVSGSSNFSTESEWTQLIKKGKYLTKAQLAGKILNLNERKWNRENILLSEIIKENRGNLDSYALTNYLNQRLRLQEHFNWLVWAVGYYYYQSLFIDPISVQNDQVMLNDCGLLVSQNLDWLNGFEWKGVFIRIQTEQQSKFLFEEMKALNYAFFEYAQIVDTYKQTDVTNPNLLSNELIFPLVSYSKICGMVLFASVCIKKANSCEINDSESLAKQAELLYQPIIHPATRTVTNFPEAKIIHHAKVCNAISKSHKKQNFQTKIIFDRQAYQNMDIKSERSDNNNNNDISHHIDNPNNSFHSMSSQNAIDVQKYSYDDLRGSKIFEKINQKHLIKVIDDNKCKFMIINAVDLIPNIIELEKQRPSWFIKIEPQEEKPLILFKESTCHGKRIKLKEFFEQEKSSHTQMQMENYEDTFEGIHFKILFTKGYSNVKNTRITEYFTNILSKQINPNVFNSKIISQIQNINLKNHLTQNQIYGKAMILFEMSNDIKIKYSLLKSSTSIGNDDLFSGNYLKKANYVSYFDGFCKYLDSNFHLLENNPNELKNIMHRFGINLSFSFFILPKVRRSNISDVIKLDILAKLVKHFFTYHEGINFLLKINCLNSSMQGLKDFTLSVLNDGCFEFIKENSLASIRKVKLYYSILSILNIATVPKAFSSFFYDNINYFFYYKLLKWRSLDEQIGFNLWSYEHLLTQNILLEDFISTARSRPFLFLTFLENHLNFTIDPVTKFKASVSLESFLPSFKSYHILNTDPHVVSYMKCNELACYLFAKCIKTSQMSIKNGVKGSTIEMQHRQSNSKCSKDSSTEYNISITHNEAKGNVIINPPYSLRTKMNLIEHQEKDIGVRGLTISDKNLPRVGNMNISVPTISTGEVNSNKMAMQRANNVKSEPRDTQSQSGIKRLHSTSKMSKENTQLMQHRAQIWNRLGREMDLHFPSVVYKLLYKNKPIKKNVHKYLSNIYAFSEIDAVKDWKSNTEMLLNEIISVDGSEAVMLYPYLILFIHSFFIEEDYDASKEILKKMKEIMRNVYSYKFEWMAIANFVEGLMIEKNNYIECEEYYSKCLIFSLFLFGDPRGRMNYGNNFMLFPLWKIGRQTCLLENCVLSENFKEMFHSQDFIYQSQYDSSSALFSKANSLFIPNLTYLEKITHIPVNKKQIYKNYSYKSDNIYDEDLNENQSQDLIECESFSLSEKNFENINCKSRKTIFPFPSMSDVKTSYSSYFNSENFISFLFEQIFSTFMHPRSISYDEEYLDSINLNCFSIFTSANNNNNNVITAKSSSKLKKEKGAIFSSFMYDYIMEQLNYKRYPPNGIVISWGINSHNETTHNFYDFISLPRVCYKLKDEQVRKLSSGWEHSIIITKNKICYSWGGNEAGQCGIGESHIIFNPSQIGELTDIVQVSCGNDHSLALDQNGHVFSWGKSEDGVLGYMEKEIEYTPKRLSTLENIVSISSGTIHNLALSIDGAVYSWGCSKGGQLGHSESFLVNIDNFKGYVMQPTMIEALKNKQIVKISCGEAHSLALTNDGKVYGWGFTSNGQLGLGFCEDSFEPGQGMIKSRILVPRLVEFNSNVITDIQCGKTFSMLISEKNELFACGVNDLIQLGIDKKPSTDHLFQKQDIYYNRCCDIVWPTLNENFLNMKVLKVSCGESHCLALIEDLSNKAVSLWSWGSNRFGQLGQGNQVKKSMPKPINYLLGYTNSQVIDFACGAFHSICLIANLSYARIEEDEQMTSNIISSYSRKWM